jgi:hypothetical protein
MARGREFAVSETNDAIARIRTTAALTLIPLDSSEQ